MLEKIRQWKIECCKKIRIQTRFSAFFQTPSLFPILPCVLIKTRILLYYPVSNIAISPIYLFSSFLLYNLRYSCCYFFFSYFIATATAANTVSSIFFIFTCLFPLTQTDTLFFRTTLLLAQLRNPLFSLLFFSYYPNFRCKSLQMPFLFEKLLGK